MEAIAYLLTLLDIHNLEESKDERDPTEIIVFLIIEGILFLVRLVAIIYFIIQAWHHSQFSKEKRDPYTLYSFLFIGLSLILLFLYRLSMFMESIILAIYHGDNEVQMKIE